MLQKILVSNIISHGFLDYYNDIFTNNYFFLFYLLSISINFLLISLKPNLMLSIFVLLSSNHFGNDYYTITKNKKYKILGLSLFLNTIIVDYDLWSRILDIILSNNNDTKIIIIFITIINVFLLLIYIDNIYLMILFCLQFILCKLLGVISFLLLYMNIIHVPIALYNKYKKFGHIPILIHLSAIIPVYFLPLIINQLTLTLSISIVNTHMIMHL